MSNSAGISHCHWTIWQSYFILATFLWVPYSALKIVLEVGTAKVLRDLWAFSETPQIAKFAVLTFTLPPQRYIIEFWNTNMIWNRMLWVKLCNQYCRHYVEVCCINYIMFYLCGHILRKIRPIQSILYIPRIVLI